MWIAVIGIVLAVALVVGPVYWLRPSDRDSRIARLRARAAELSIKVKVVPRDQLKVDPGDFNEPIPMYFLHWDPRQPREKAMTALDQGNNWVLSYRKTAHDIHFYGHWQWLSGKAPHGLDRDSAKLAPLKSFIDQLGSDIKVLQCKPDGVAVGWIERGDKTRVDGIKEQLLQLKECCAACFGQ